MTSDYLTSDQVALAAGISRRHVRRWAQARGIPRIWSQTSHRHLYPAAEIQAAVAPSATPEAPVPVTVDRADRDALAAFLAGSRGRRHARAVALCGGDRDRARHLVAVYDRLAARPVSELPVFGVRPGRVLTSTETPHCKSPAVAA